MFESCKLSLIDLNSWLLLREFGCNIALMALSLWSPPSHGAGAVYLLDLVIPAIFSPTPT